MVKARRNRPYKPKTLGSMRSWQYSLVVSWIASSSSVNRLAEARGSSQLKVEAYLRPIGGVNLWQDAASSLEWHVKVRFSMMTRLRGISNG